MKSKSFIQKLVCLVLLAFFIFGLSFGLIKGTKIAIVKAEKVETFDNTTENEQDILPVHDLTSQDLNMIELQTEVKIMEQRLCEKGILVEDVLRNLSASYDEILNEGNEKFRKLAEATSVLYNQYRKNQASTYAINPNFDAVATSIVACMTAYFIEHGYSLSAELLTVCYNNKQRGWIYEPVYGGKVLASQLTYDIVNSLNSPAEGSGKYLDEGRTNERDLYYALREFRYYKVGNKKILIRDTYDFTFVVDDDGNLKIEDFVDLGIDVATILQILNYLIPMDVLIEADISDPLPVIAVRKYDNIWKVAVTNESNNPIDVIYNEKMCFEADAVSWKGLSNITTITLMARGSTVFEIMENGAADYVAISYIKENKRVILLANELDAETHKVNSYCSTVKYTKNGSPLTLLGYNDNKWLIQVENTFEESIKLEYNQKMCGPNDASTWTDLKDLKTLYLKEAESTVIEVAENGLATHIAIQLEGDKELHRYSLNQLNKDGTMNISQWTYKAFKYLSLINLGKNNGKWKIRIKNPLKQEITVEYNKKMCFEGDAKNWTGLKDVESISISANSSKDVEISTNVFATCIAISYKIDGYRVISYANGLNSNKDIYVMNNYIEV